MVLACQQVSAGACLSTDKVRDICTFPFISFLGELSCVDGILSFLVNENQDKCRWLHEQAAIIVCVVYRILSFG